MTSRERRRERGGGYCHTLPCYIFRRGRLPRVLPRSSSLFVRNPPTPPSACSWNWPPTPPRRRTWTAAPPGPPRRKRRRRPPRPGRPGSGRGILPLSDFVGGEKAQKRKKDMFLVHLVGHARAEKRRRGGTKQAKKYQKPIREAPKLSSCKLPRIML